MKTRVKVGLVIGLISVIPNLCAAGVIDVFGLFVPLAAGLLAGFFTARREKLPTKAAGAQAGAFSGLIAGIVLLLVQVLFTVAVEMIMPGAPDNRLYATSQAYQQSIIIGLIMYLVAALLAGLTGAIAGYLSTPAA